MHLMLRKVNGYNIQSQKPLPYKLERMHVVYIFSFVLEYFLADSNYLNDNFSYNSHFIIAIKY